MQLKFTFPLVRNWSEKSWVEHTTTEVHLRISPELAAEIRKAIRNATETGHMVLINLTQPGYGYQELIATNDGELRLNHWSNPHTSFPLTESQVLEIIGE